MTTLVVQVEKFVQCVCFKTILIQLRFYVPLDTKSVISETFPMPISWFAMEKQNLPQQKHIFTSQKKCSLPQQKININKKASIR